MFQLHVMYVYSLRVTINHQKIFMNRNTNNYFICNFVLIYLLFSFFSKTNNGYYLFYFILFFFLQFILYISTIYFILFFILKDMGEK